MKPLQFSSARACLCLPAMLTLALLTPTASHAQVLSFNYSDQDVMLGLRKSGVTDNLEIDLGPVSQFYSPSAAVIPVANAALITSVFGTDLSSLRWSAAATLRTAASATAEHPVQSLWLTRFRTDPNVQSTPWTTQTLSTQGSTGAKIQSLGDNAETFAGLNSMSILANQAVAIPGTSASSYSRYAGSGAAGFGATANFNNTFQGDVEAQNPSVFTSGFVRADLYQLNPAASLAARGPATYLGYLEMGYQGDVTFHSTLTAVPEPSEIAMVTGLGLASFAFIRRRMKSKA